MREVRELFDAATRDIPAGVLRPPLAVIRRRAARRRILWPISISGVLSAIVAGAALAFAGSGAEPAPVPPIPLFPWSHAYAAEGGRSLTIHLYSPGRCETVRRPHATVAESEGAVTVTMTGEVVRADDCSSATGPIVIVRLDRPLGGRGLRDGARDQDRPVFREEQVPPVPAGSGGWQQVPASQRFFEGEPAMWHAAFTKPGGPDVSIDAYVKGLEWPMQPAIGTIRLGTRERSLHSAGATYQLSWDDGPVLYVLRLSPTEGGSVSEAEFREVVGLLVWP